MEVHQIIREIDTYLSLYPIKIEKSPVIPAGIQHSSLLKTGTTLDGMHFADESKRDENLERLIENCSEEMLDELIQTLGEDSSLAGIIRRKKRKPPRTRQPVITRRFSNPSRRP